MTIDPSQWQELTRNSGLMLHAAFGDFRPQLATLQTEFAALDRATAPEHRGHLASDGSWSSIPLITRAPRPLSPGVPVPGLDLMPSLRDLLGHADWSVIDAHVLRQPPHGILPWHFEDQAPYSAETRLLFPLHAPAAARTLVGHEAAAYPEGMGWAADVNQPHQVENPTDDQRIILVIDVVSGPPLHRLFPPALLSDIPHRLALAERARGMVLTWRSEQAERQ